MPAAIAKPRLPVNRLGSINRLANVPKQKPRKAKDTCCPEPNLSDDDGQKICLNCGSLISESNIVADVTFGEDSRGAATVQGGFIGENSRHARTLGSAAFRKIGGGERNSMQEIEATGRKTLDRLCPRLSIPDNVKLQAQSLFNMAAGFNFNAGRKTDEVVAACLFAACRRNERNSIMLIDIAELIKVSVFRLGEVWKDLRTTTHYYDETIGIQEPVHIEDLIERFCEKLDFRGATKQVKEDAFRIIKRMKRDWMVTGRHPAGLCGACIILAARMNNFQRSVREVVLVAKVADVTVAKRIEEFKSTKAAALSVEQFREFGVRLNYPVNPPSLQSSKEKQEKFAEKQRQRQAETTARETGERQPEDGEPIVIDDDRASSSSASPTPDAENGDGAVDEHRRKRQRTGGPLATPAATQQPPRFDADGFAIPALPTTSSPSPAINPAVTGDANGDEQPRPKRKRGRPPKNARPQPVVEISPEELATEAQVKKDIEIALEDKDLQEATEEARKQKEEEAIERAGENAKVLAGSEAQLAAERERQRRNAEGINWWADREAGAGEIVTEADLEAEFADDPEVLNCMLTADEAKLKEQIWVAHNEDWLRSQHEKELLKRVAEAAKKNQDPSKQGAKGGRKKKSRLGDRSVLEDAETPIDTPADAAHAMLKKRATNNFSKFVDYEKLARVYGRNSTPASSTSQSRAGTEAPNSRAGSATPSAVSGAARESATPAPQERTVRFGLQSPQGTQATQAAPARAPATPSQPAAGDEQAPMSPPATQAQVGAEADEEQGYDGEMEVDEDYQSQAGEYEEFGGEDDREDIGEEDDYYRAIDPGNTMEDTYGDEEEYE